MTETFIRPLVLELLTDFVKLGAIKKAEGVFNLPSLDSSFTYKAYVIGKESGDITLRIDIEERKDEK